MQALAEITLEAHPNTVSRARRLVGNALSGPLADLAEDAKLVVSELVTNAQLHGAPPIILRVLSDGSAVRIEVEDAGHAIPLPARQDPELMTGRGLTVVASLARAWGVELAPNSGKVVWAEVVRADDTSEEPATEELDIEALLGAWTDDEDGEERYVVTSPEVPMQLVLATKTHVDNFRREVGLAEREAAETGVPLPSVLAEFAEACRLFEPVRESLQRQGIAVGLFPHSLPDVRVRLPLSAAEAGERYLAALDAIDDYARNGHLLSPPAAPDQVAFRRWYIGSVAEQLRAAASDEQIEQSARFDGP